MNAQISGFGNKTSSMCQRLTGAVQIYEDKPPSAAMIRAAWEQGKPSKGKSKGPGKKGKRC